MERIWRIRGVVLLAVIFIIVYTLEFWLATILGFSDARAMLATLSYDEKRFVAYVVGPFLHQGTTHLFENLVFLLAFGAYVEWQIGLRPFVIYSTIIGYGATWLLLSTGSVGAVGASSITNGLEPIAGFIGLTRLTEGLLEIRNTKALLKTTSHSVPLVFGLGFAWRTIQAGMETFIDATVAIHALGTLVGILIGLWYISQSFLTADRLPFHATK